MYYIKLNNDKSIVEQLCSQLTSLIDEGVLGKGEKLLSCRELAKELDINPNTVNKAYKQLEEEGYLVTVYKKGMFVSENGKEKVSISDKDIYRVFHMMKESGISKEEAQIYLREVYR